MRYGGGGRGGGGMQSPQNFFLSLWASDWTKNKWGNGGRAPQAPLLDPSIKAMLRGFSGGKQVINFANTRNRGRVCLFLTTENEQIFIVKTIMESGGSDHFNFFGCSSD